MKKLLIDINSIVPFYVSGKLNGIGRTTLELINEFDKLSDNLPFEIALFSQNMKGIGGKNVGLSFKNRHLYFPHRVKFDKISAKLHLRELLYNYDVMHIPHNFEYVANPEKCIVTIHDAMFFAYPEKMFNPDFAKKHYTEFARKSKAIITCSESSKNDIVSYMGVEPDKVSVAHWGVDNKLFYPRKNKGNEYCGQLPYFISVSCDIGRKNTISVIRAYNEFFKNNPAHHLILVWREPPEVILKEIESYKCKNNIHFARNISNEELVQLYSDATACFFPSLYEGFGLPVLESFAAGTPVITCNNSSLVEVGGDAAIYVEPYDIKTMSDIMENFENGSYDYDSLRKLSIEQASKFTWEKCARKTLEVYKRCLDI